MFYDCRQECLVDTLDTKQRLLVSVRHGYGCVIYEHRITHPTELSLKPPIEILDLHSMIRVTEIDKERCIDLIGRSQGIQQLKRITVSTDKPDESAPSSLTVEYQAQFLLHSSRNSQLRSYDIIACLPRSTEVLRMACEKMEIDVISLNSSQSIKPRQGWLKTAISRGIFLELSYCPDQHLPGAARQTATAFWKKIFDMTGGKGIIISSGCEEGKYLRSPYDVINLAQYVGLSQQQALRSLTINCEKAIGHGVARRLKAQSIIPWEPSRTTASPEPDSENKKKRQKTEFHT